MEEKLLKLVAESDNLVEIADKYIMFKYFEQTSIIFILLVLFGIAGYIGYKMIKEFD